MLAAAKAFSTSVHLACRVSYGPGATLRVSGTALKIDLHSVEIALPANIDVPYPQLGETVHLEVHLPVDFAQAGPKCLTARARVSRTREMTDQSRQLLMTFRRASFGDPKIVSKSRRGAAR
jgi:hypothetical protein